MRVQLRAAWAETYPELWPSNTYEVIAIEYGNYRIVDDVGEPILFNQRAFTVTDPTPTLDWVSTDPEHVQPSDWLPARGMMSRFFDDDDDARRRFRSYMHRLVHARRVPTFVCSYRRYVETRRRLVAYLELAPEGDEVRRVERFDDGTVGWADGKGGNNFTKLMVNGPTDPRSPNRADGDAISRQEFEAQWWQALDIQP